MAIIGEFTAIDENQKERERRIGKQINDFLDEMREHCEKIKQQLHTPVGDLTQDEMKLLLDQANAIDLTMLKEEVGCQAALMLVVAKQMQKDEGFTNALWKKIVDLDKEQARVMAYRIYAMCDFKRIMKYFANTLLFS